MHALLHASRIGCRPALVMVMRKHQRYFSLYKYFSQDLLPHFITVANGPIHEPTVKAVHPFMLLFLPLPASASVSSGRVFPGAPVLSFHCHIPFLGLPHPITLANDLMHVSTVKTSRPFMLLHFITVANGPMYVPTVKMRCHLMRLAIANGPIYVPTVKMRCHCMLLANANGHTRV